LIVTDRLPCATAQASSVTAWFITTEPVRALITTLAAGGELDVEVLDVGHEGHARVGRSGMRTRTTRPSSACACRRPCVR
jgi:hypothetical protein